MLYVMKSNVGWFKEGPETVSTIPNAGEKVIKEKKKSLVKSHPPGI